MNKLLTANNKLNLMFLSAVTVSILAQELLGKVGKALPIPGLVIIALVALIVNKFFKVSYTEDKSFLNHKGELIKKYPTKIFLVIILSIATTFLLSMILDQYSLRVLDALPVTFGFSVLFSCIVSYFIYLDCPITILLNKNAWQKHITGYDRDAKATFNQAMHNNSSDLFAQSSGTRSFNKTNLSTDYSYKHLNSNIHNPNRFK